MVYHLAIDIGASGGRHILGCVDDGALSTKEVYRFENGIKSLNGKLIWDTEELTSQVIKGIAKCKELGVIPQTVAIDTWGVDYVLLDAKGQEILPAYAYRDGETAFVQEEVASVVSRDELYAVTGIQHQNFNTVYRLYCDKKAGRLDNAEVMLMMPEYLSYKLTGKIGHEYTNATTTNLVNAAERDWDRDLISRLGLPQKLFGKIEQPPYCLGEFAAEVVQKVGFNASVLLCPSHDTASAVAACPMFGAGAYISSGTWSLVGTENTEPVLSKQAKEANLTNEGGVFGTYRFLKNIMGMWLFQGIRRSVNKQYSYDEMMALAEQSDYKDVFDPNDSSLVAPPDMLSAIRKLLGDDELPLGDVLAAVYHSLASCYARTIAEIENIAHRRFDAVHIIGGGSKDVYLNKLTAKYTGKAVFAGPVEATAIGNLISQCMYCDRALDLDAARQLVRKSFNITKIDEE